ALRGSDCPQPRVAATGYYEEPSLVFLLGTDTRFTDGTGAAIFLGQGSCRFALIDARSVASFVQRANSIGLHYALVQRFDGYNISVGRPVTFTLFRSAENP
ncbi:MAG: glycosyl transferase, partial [Pseudolabrys sp.]